MANDDELKRFARRTYTRTDDQGNQVMGIKSSNPGLTIERLRRCQNCIHFDIGEKAMSYFNHCIERDRKTLREKGCDPQGIEEHVQSLNRSIRDRLGVVGICQAKDKRTDDDAHGDFTAFHFQCSTWTGRMIVTPEEAATDPSAAEVMANLKKVEGS